MIRFIARRWAKLSYVFKEEKLGALHGINANAALYQADKRREAIKSLNAEADKNDAQAAAIDERVKQMAEMEQKGYYLCEDGHETDKPLLNGTDSFSCPFPVAGKANGICNKLMQLIIRSKMTGQEIYESEKERRAVEKMADQNRQTAAACRNAVKEHEARIKEHEQAAEMYNNQAQQSRAFADVLRKL